MVNILNRAELFVDTSAEAAAKVWTKLEEAGIEYEMVTMRPGGDVRAHHGVIGVNGSVNGGYIGDLTMFIYKIYVKRSELEHARKVCEI